jgi:spore maturation protein CgeB
MAHRDSAALQQSMTNFAPDLYIGFKNLTITREIFMTLKCPKAHFHPDDSTIQINRSPHFEEIESLFDFHFTPKSFNVSEIATRTQNEKVHYLPYAYDEDWHFPRPRKAEYLIGFIGHRREDRRELIDHLSARYGKEFLVSGAKWNRNLSLVRRSTVLPPQYGVNYSKIAHKTTMLLGLLNSENRDLHTARSYEIPATGSLFIGERTKEHLSMFTDMEDGCLFSDEVELLSKIDYLTENPGAVRDISARGLKRIQESNGSWIDRAKEMILRIG